ncbi:TonB-dependent receptor [Flavitalea sp. BT771]|uniref:SusC/RagA family TonB-linked outer membrane protein n=1 Tax=Flavitalea sp. BT771 TaxID=3063329 RepID=UPI0026E1FC8F|nr:TonB-dependent receptor [Flavitalea sp. BT771]MDO6430306.1 TonB-dependent receptor [Flavitalea sp. BT771]MDV6219554.1 TonB-dependent receptor [Flavitalea sp. BT771]
MKKQRLKRAAVCLFWVALNLLLFSAGGHAQNPPGTKKITGKVVISPGDKPLQGASVMIKGRTTGTQTDKDGLFSLNAGEGDVLIISFIGFSPREVKVGARQALNIRMEVEDKSRLNDVVVIGYGKVRRPDVTGSISSISGAELMKTQPTTFDQALQGKVAGVVVQQVSGQPGGGVSIQIRGVSSISGTNSPLYVIDGIIIPPVGDPGSGSNPLNTINPAEIESIDVLKDASATAIYGSQATNGVVVITTKRGRVAAPQVSYDGYAGYQEIPKRLPTMNLQQLATYINARGQVWGFDVRPEFANPKYLGPGTDWQKELFRKAPEMSHTLTVSGGDNRTQYLLSGSYFKQKGMALGSDFQRYSVRLNLDNKTTSWLKVGTSLQMAHVFENVNTTTSSIIGSALNLTPDIPVQNLDGSWGGVTNTSGWVPGVVNPVAIAQLVKNQRKRNQLFGNAYAEIQITKDLSLRNEVSGNFDFSTQDVFTPTYTFGKTVNGTNSGSTSMNQNFYTVLRNYLTYNHYFSTFNLNALVGHEAQSSSYENSGGSRSNFPSNNVQALNAGDATTAKNSGDNGLGSSQESYFGRINFSWKDKYLVTGNVRNDGSSNFPANNRWVTTWSGAIAWKISNEIFMKSLPAINELKLRLGYGLTNNQGIPGNTFATQLSTVANGLSGIAQFQSNLANPNVSWEKTDYYNAGLDATFLNGRISFNLDAYYRKTDGLLLKIPLPIYSGTTTGYSPGSMQAPYVNVGAVSNKGFDFRVSSTNINFRDFTWKTDVTVSRNVNKVLNLGSGNQANLSQKSYVINDIIEKTVVGQPIGEFYGYLFDGIFAHPTDFQKHALPADQSGNPYPISAAGGGIWYGDRMFKDLNGDGIIDTKDQTFLGSPIPKFQFGINNTFVYKNFDLNIFLSGSVGNKVFNELAVAQTNSQNNTNYFASVLNYAKLALVDPSGSASDINNVYVSNPNTHVAGLRNDNTNGNNRPSNLFIEDGSFLRCKNITVGYRLPEKVLSRVHLQSFRVFATVSNAFIISKYSGMDPEIGSWNPLQAGWDNGYYPQPRIYTIGANIAFAK